MERKVKNTRNRKSLGTPGTTGTDSGPRVIRRVAFNWTGKGSSPTIPAVIDKVLPLPAPPPPRLPVREDHPIDQLETTATCRYCGARIHWGEVTDYDADFTDPTTPRWVPRQSKRTRWFPLNADWTPHQCRRDAP